MEKPSMCVPAALTDMIVFLAARQLISFEIGVAGEDGRFQANSWLDTL